MIKLENYAIEIEKFIWAALDKFTNEIQKPNCMILHFHLDKSQLSIHFSINQEIEHIIRDKQTPEYPEFKKLSLASWQTNNLTKDSVYKNREDEFKWIKTPYKTCFDAFIRHYLNGILTKSYKREIGVDVFVNTDYMKDWKYRKLVYTDKEDQIGRFIVSRLRDTPMEQLEWIRNLKESNHKSNERFVRLYKSLNEEQKEDIQELFLEIIDKAIFDFLTGVDETPEDNKFDGIILMENKKIDWDDYLGGGYKEEFFLWIERYSRFYKSDE